MRNDEKFLADKCPTCGCSLFVGEGGWITCSGLSCKAPSFEMMIEKVKSDSRERLNDLLVELDNLRERYEQ